jgi:hypothetical protein
VTVLGWLIVLMVGSVALAAGLVLSLIFTNPLAIGPLGVTLWFVGLFLALSGIFTLAFYGTKTYLHLHATGSTRLRYSWRQGMLLATWVAGLLSLSSLRQLGVLDAILLGILLVIIEVYVRLRWP